MVLNNLVNLAANFGYQKKRSSPLSHLFVFVAAAAAVDSVVVAPAASAAVAAAAVCRHLLVLLFLFLLLHGAFTQKETQKGMQDSNCLLFWLSRRRRRHFVVAQVDRFGFVFVVVAATAVVCLFVRLLFSLRTCLSDQLV